MTFEHQSPGDYSVLEPQSYESIAKDRGSSYPIDERKRHEDAIRKKLKLKDDLKSFISFSLSGYNQMPTKNGPVYRKSFSPEEIGKMYFESIVDESQGVGGVGEDGLRAAIDHYKNSIKKAYNSGELTIHPRVEAYVPFEVKPDSVVKEKQASTFTDSADIWDQDREEFHRISVPDIWEIVKNRRPKEIEIEKVWGGTESSPGFSEERLQSADTSYPLILDNYTEGEGFYGGLVDGRHRKIKLLRQGKTKTKAIKLTKDEIKKLITSSLSQKGGGIIPPSFLP